MTEATVDDPSAVWEGLDPAWRTAFELAWEAVRSGNIGVGSVATSPDGTIIASDRNRVAEMSAPPGQVAGTSLAHAEINVLRECGEGPLIDMALRLERDEGLNALLPFQVDDLLAHVWDDLNSASQEMARN